MRILFICNEYPPCPHGGIGIVIKDLAILLSESGHNVCVIGYDQTVHSDQYQSENDIIVYRLFDEFKNLKGLRMGRFFLNFNFYYSRHKLSKKLEEVIKEFNPDFIESYDWSGPLWSKPSKPLIIRIHGANSAYQDFEGKRKSKLLYYLEKKNLKMADHFCAVSQHIGEITQKTFSLKQDFSVLYNFIDEEIFRPGNNSKKIPYKLLYVGRIHPRKGIEELMIVLNYLLKRNDKIQIDLIGQYEKAYLQKLLRILDPEFQNKQVHFLGRISHERLPLEYQKATLVLMPSRAEAFGLVAIEAMACGTPVVMTNKASGPEIIKDGFNGKLIDFTRSENAAEEIYMLLKNNFDIERMSENAINTVQNRFTKSLFKEKNISFYRSLVHKKSSF